MDLNYIIERLKSTPYKYPTVEVLKNRLNNLEETQRQQILSGLKMQLYKERNIDIQEPLSQLVYQLPLTA